MARAEMAFGRHEKGTNIHVTKIPEIEESGSSGEQKRGDLEVIPAEPETLFPVDEVLQGLVEARPGSLGGYVAAPLIGASFRELLNQLTEAKSELKTTRACLDQVRSDLASCQIREAVLEERVSSAASMKHLRNATIAVGMLLLGLATSIDGVDQAWLSWVLGGLGLLMAAMGWLWPTSGSKQ